MKEQDLLKLEQLKVELENAETNVIEENNVVELLEKEVILPKEDKPKKTSRSKKAQLTKEEIQEMLDDHFARVKELLKDTENEICFRVYKGVNVALSRHLGGK
ncbi:hypothetical protein [Desulforamulus aeronauticus]|uniref:Uncharacterized protein n=1 Tax=Desulforamulus aeronauticus DSM 10349 TaxID=1121421 RepID=A0A1M6SB83_9FIRM|nr:hypothetical protein [Desulforamulus aeronauticus]SHK41965.1 hypothetical protein SAMN02745123_01781 [Desulforamulus aeronauticus DSM 10349]